MDSKFFNIPFLTPSSDSDFSCKDGELASAGNAVLNVAGERFDDFSLLPGDGDISAPVPEINFAIVRDTLKGWHIHPDQYPSKTVVASAPSMEYWNKVAAGLLSQFQSEAAMQNLFTAPFYAIAAWKTYGGGYLSPSSPELMIPNSSVPLVTTDAAVDSLELDLKIAGAVCSLYYKIRTPEYLRDWVGKIESLEILVSNPLQKYATFDSLLPLRHVSTDSMCRSLDLSSGEIADRRISGDTFPMAWKANMAAGSKYSSPPLYFSFANIPLAEFAPSDTPVWKDLRGYYQDMDGVAKTGKGVSFEDILAGSSRIRPSEVIIEGTGNSVSLITRPIKLDNAGKLKNICRLYLRGCYTPGNLTISVYASRDMLRWWCISKRKGGTVVGFPRSPFRFFRVEISGLLSSSENLQGLTLSLNPPF